MSCQPFRSKSSHRRSHSTIRSGRASGPASPVPIGPGLLDLPVEVNRRDPHVLGGEGRVVAGRLLCRLFHLVGPDLAVVVFEPHLDAGPHRADEEEDRPEENVPQPPEAAAAPAPAAARPAARSPEDQGSATDAPGESQLPFRPPSEKRLRCRGAFAHSVLPFLNATHANEEVMLSVQTCRYENA